MSSVVAGATSGAIEAVVTSHRQPTGLPLVCSCGVGLGHVTYSRHVSERIATALETLGLLRTPPSGQGAEK